MSHDFKTWEEFNKGDGQKAFITEMYTSLMDKLHGKQRGSNFTPPKKKRKKK